ncbi:MAG: arnT 2 [Bacteroidetes bacterium]|jgi:4-amino-4-deoxy-L-arabinose transferase-like glycosyltransferase|nr:arnT 2 [Bacteroidota bacterium]
MIQNLKNSRLFHQVAIVVFAILLFIPGLGSVHLFDWDEINFAESAREMLATGDFLTVRVNFEPFWEKPPLFIWMQAASMKIFGVNEFAARFPNVIAGIVTLLVLFNIGRKLKDTRFGYIWVMVYAGSLLPFFYFKSGIIDPWFNLFIFLGTYFFVLFTNPENKGNKYLQVATSGLFLGLAILTKGPVGFLIFLLTFGVYLIFKKFRISYTWKQVLLFFAVLGLVGSTWFILQIIHGNYTIIQDFIVYQIRLFQTKDAGHGGFLLYHFVIVLMGVFPASILALPAFSVKAIKTETNPSTKHFYQWMMILFWVVIVLFTIVKTKIVHYSSMTYFPLSFIAAWYVDKLLSKQLKFPEYLKFLLVALAVIYGLAVTAITLFDKFKQSLFPYVKDEFALGNMQATSTWYGFEPVFGILLIVTTVFFIVKTNKAVKLTGFHYLFGGSLFFIFSTMLFVVPQVEKYSQVAAIEFYQSKVGEDCYIYPTFKSYAHYFYSDRQPANNCANDTLLKRGVIDKPCYFVVKNTEKKMNKFKSEVPDARLLYSKNGFSFFIRNAVSKK